MTPDDILESNYYTLEAKTLMHRALDENNRRLVQRLLEQRTALPTALELETEFDCKIVNEGDNVLGFDDTNDTTA